MLVGGTASATALGACTPQTPAVATVAPTTQSIPTQVEPTPTNVIVVEAGGFEMVLVEPGSFQMGSASGRSAEQPVHTVSITEPFYVSKYEVTFDQYDEFHKDARSGSPPPDDGGWGRGNRPVTRVTWYDAVKYCNWLSERERLTPCYSGGGITTECDFMANGYRLPTEAEWEYAARGGCKSQGFTYAGSDNVDDVGWYLDNSGGQIQPVGQKKPNELGLCDMSGDVWDFCWDWYEIDYYKSSPSSDPTGGAIPSPYERKRARRGGAWDEAADSLRIAFRSHDWPDFVDNCNGFRIVRTAQNS